MAIKCLKREWLYMIGGLPKESVIHPNLEGKPVIQINSINVLGYFTMSPS